MRPAALSLLAALAACATARPVAMREIRARGPDESRAVTGLQMLFTLQMAYQARHDRFAATTDELRDVGFTDHDFTGSYRPVITDAGSRLCVAMLPTGERRRPAWSMNGRGEAFRGARCGR